MPGLKDRKCGELGAFRVSLSAVCPATLRCGESYLPDNSGRNNQDESPSAARGGGEVGVGSTIGFTIPSRLTQPPPRNARRSSFQISKQSA